MKPIAHHEMMLIAISQAMKAGEKQEVPVGAVLIDENGEILSANHNQTIGMCDPTAHAEILALREAALKIRNYRLSNTSLYVTMEPCVMCMGAIIHARVSELVFGAADAKWGGAGSVYDFSGDAKLNHRLEIVRGVCEDECKSLIRAFFRERRKL
jgi:tRNA(adenine34) deaminase